ncbi:beta-galactosidase [Pontiella sulfatireligans]|uniref:Glycoside hydrolase family 42 N-terminal domain-containing protein n=1 Tax=Pontiella sulfatireligans TaxID=2750658 RepID=A0A6C2UIR0_9BACT|nr:beta-galactosidase [Pontiella sulfatireligans]VGO19763.1 hypothetical protein SCARR_01822 [Pontiella sulfatireligans]
MFKRCNLFLMAGHMFVALLAANADQALHPLKDTHPLKMAMAESRIMVSEEVADPRRPVSTILRPKEGLWDCSSKLWLLVDVENNGATSVLVRAELTSDKKTGWGENRGAVVVPAGEKCSLPILILRGMIEGRDSDGLKAVFGEMRGFPGGYHNAGWRRIDASKLKRVKLDFFTDAPRVECEVSNLRAATDFKLPSNEVLKTKYRPASDEFGQERHSDWKFKIKTSADFPRRLESEKVWLDQFQTLENRSRYGGWTGGERFPATGHFQALEKEGIWWLADPEGYPFWSIGATGFNLGLGKTTTPGIGPWNPRQANLKEKYGADWQAASMEFTHRRLRAWGMNTLGNWSSPEFYFMGKTPYTVACHFSRPSIHEANPKAHSSLPDVFHPDYRKNTFDAVARFTREAQDPWCIGYFIDNELPFPQPTSPAQKALLSPKSCFSRQELIRRLKDKYSTMEKLNTAWNTKYTNWDAMSPPEGNYTQARGADMLEFSEAWYHLYFNACRDAMREHAPNKLYLGSRINHTKNKTALSICAEYADVVSINFYDYTPQVFQAPEGFNAPIMIGEFHFGTITERGVWGGGLCTGMDIGHAASLFENYFEQAVKNPLIVGAHWFKFSDQPLTGRKDGENYRIGFVDVADTPYPEMVNACRSVAEKMYELRITTVLEKE